MRAEQPFLVASENPMWKENFSPPAQRRNSERGASLIEYLFIAGFMGLMIAGTVGSSTRPLAIRVALTFHEIDGGGSGGTGPIVGLAQCIERMIAEGTYTCRERPTNGTAAE
jgi:Flp pilus assembly pilin Flp